MKNCKVIVTATTFPRFEGDKQPSFVKDLSKEFVNNNLDVSVLVPHSYKLKKYIKENQIKIHRFRYFLSKYEKVAYGGIIPNIKKNKFLILQIPLLFIFQLISLIKLNKKNKYDVLHSHWIFPQGLNGAILKKLFRIKHILTIHGGDLFILLKIPFGRRLIKFVLKNTDYVTCVNNEIKDSLLKIIKFNKIKVISMGVYTKEYYTKPNFNRNILFLGRFAEKKGLMYLLRAINLIRNKKFKLYIAGDGPLKKDLEEFIFKNNLMKKVKFLGYVDGKKKLNLIRSCSIFILPSITTNEGDREGLPVSLLEAMSCGRAIISTNVGGIKEIIKNNYNGILIEEKNINKIKEAIINLLSNKDLVLKLGKNAQKTIKDYDWSLIGKKYINIIKG